MTTTTYPTVALSLRQPWAAFVLDHGKRVENRRWNTRFRGPFYIHAAKGMTVAEFDEACDMLDDVNGLQPVMDPKALQRGGIVGRARLVDVIKPRPEFLSMGVETWYPEALRDHGWRWNMREQFGFVLEDIVPLP